MEKIQIIGVISSFALFLFVLELVRRRALKERYSILWLASTLVLLVFSFWKDLMIILAGWMGVVYPPLLIFLLAFVFLIFIVLHFSVVISRLTEKNSKLAQDLGLLRLQIENREGKQGKAQTERQKTD